MAKFIYVFSEESYRRLLEMGYEPVTANGEKGIFVFLNREQQVFSTNDFQYAFSDTLVL